ncbi:uncharacterized protein [Prorops nasuta]|uniref:uncharacterized protein n=1 Tax=Prorops nasuta TaxID=863751 RepID=UPI0034CE320B
MYASKSINLLQKNYSGLTLLTTVFGRSLSNTTAKTYYDTLEVPFDANQYDIKSAYFKLSKKLHPDVNRSAEAKKKFQDITEAYEILGNYADRKKYDQKLLIKTASSIPEIKLHKTPEKSVVYEMKKPASISITDEWEHRHIQERSKLIRTIKEKVDEMRHEEITAFTKTPNNVHELLKKLGLMLIIAFSLFELIKYRQRIYAKK